MPQVRDRGGVAAMTTMIWFTLISVVGASALFIALAIYLVLIINELEAIGGAPVGYGAKASLLSKIRMGLRAIEVETGGLAPQVTRLNGQLSAIRDGVKAIDNNLGGVIAAVTKQVSP